MRIFLLNIFLFISSCFLFLNCNTMTPDKYFGVTVLNTNMFAGFADNGMLRQLDSPSSKLSGDNDETVSMKRSEVMDSKIEFIEVNYEEVKDIKETDDTKEMISASLALYEYVLPVYKTEYMQLAKLYDTDAPAEKIELLSTAIHDKYSSGYKERYDRLIRAGKLYAEKHGIKVNWGN